VTGSSTGIGRAVAMNFIREGAKVVGGDVSSSNVKEDPVDTQICDVTKVEDMQALLDHASAKHGPVSVWVNNAGVEVETQYKPFGKKVMDPIHRAGWVKMVNINMIGVMDGMRLAVPHMQQNGGGTVVNVSSMSAFLPIPTAPVYAGTKAAVNQMTRSVGLYLGQDSDVRVHAVAPSFTDTPLVHGKDGLDEYIAASGGRLLTDAEVADGVLKLVTGGKSLINGSAMRVYVGQKSEAVQDMFQYPKAFGGAP